MDDHGLVSSFPPWTWIIQKPAFVSWNHKEEGQTALGHLSPVNSTSRLSIHIGWRPAHNELLIALHLPISIRASKHPRDMFLIVPCDFDVDAIDTAFEPVQADGRVDLESAGLGDCNLFHIPFNLPKPCEVVMPRAKRQKPIKGTPKELLQRLKSLSETPAFDVYFRFDTFAQLQLRNIFASVHCLTTPALLLESMYDGRGGCINLWLNQGLGLEPPHHISIDEKKEKPYAETPQQTDPLPPPPYTNDTVPSLDLPTPHTSSHDPHKPQTLAPDLEKSRVQVPFSEGSPASTSSKHNKSDGVLETPFWVRMQRIMDYRSPSVEPPTVSRRTFKRAASVNSLDGATQQRKQIRLLQSPYPGPSPISSASIALFDSPKHEPPSPQVEPLKRIAELREQWREELANWLYSAFTLMPLVHHTLRTELVAIGHADSSSSFLMARVECTTRFAFAVAKASMQESSTATDCISTISDAEDHVRDTVAWINGVRFDADVTLMRDIVELAGAAMGVVGCVDKKNEAMNKFWKSKARCIAAACFLENTAVGG